MDGIEILFKEHENIKKFAGVVRSACLKALVSSEVNVEDFRKMVVFIRGYADEHHHGKEEKILFVEMTEKLGKVAVNLIQHGMLVEHDYGRLYVAELENALNIYENNPNDESRLDIIANAVGYVQLINRHILKEDTAVFTFGRGRLSAEVLKDIDERTEKFEEKANQNGEIDKFLELLDELYRKYPSL